MPMVGVLMRVSPLVSLIDEFAFYVYHRAPYDRGFMFVADLCWNWTNNKWVPPFLEGIQAVSSLIDYITQLNIDGETLGYPNRYADLGEANNFYLNVVQFLLVSLPLNLLLFLVVRSLHSQLSSRGLLPTVCSFLRVFKQPSTFLNTVFADNLTYLSFKCFLQLYYFVPYSQRGNIYLSCILCLLVLFVLLMVVCAMGLLQGRLFDVDCFKRRANAYSYYMGGLGCRFVAGFVHGYLGDGVQRTWGLLGTSVIALGLLAGCLSAMQTSYYKMMALVMQICRLFLHFQIFLEVRLLGEAAIMEQIDSENSVLLLIGIFGITLLLNILEKIRIAYLYFSTGNE